MGARVGVTVLAAMTLVAGCSGGDDAGIERAQPSGTTVTTGSSAGATVTTGSSAGATVTTATTVTTGSSAGATATSAASAGSATALEALRPSLVFVETPAAKGSGIVVDDGYVITNAHVVDPFARASVTPVDGKTEELTVVGADLFADIALLGPLEQDVPRRSLTEAVEARTGSDVYLIGFPGDVDDVSEPAIARGILSRQRRVEEFDLDYFQTDAAIGEGQSGGAMVNGRGQLLGISGLSYAQEFALALEASDVAAARDRIRAGAASAYHPLPDGPLVREATVNLRYRADVQVLVFPAAPAARTIELTLPDDDDVTLELGGLDGSDYLINAAAVDEQLALDDTLSAADFDKPATPVAPGQWKFDLRADTMAVAFIGVRRDDATVKVSGTEPFIALHDDDQERPLRVGDTVTGILDSIEMNDSYVVDLAVGQRIDVRAATPAGDMWFTLVPPGSWPGDAEIVDDGGGGLYDYDAQDTFTATVSGPHRLIVGDYDGVALGYRLEVEAR